MAMGYPSFVLVLASQTGGAVHMSQGYQALPCGIQGETLVPLLEGDCVTHCETV